MRKGSHHTEAMKLHIRERLQSQEIKDKMRDWHTGRKLSEETKNKVRVSMKKYLKTHRHNWSKYNKESDPEKKFHEIISKMNLNVDRYYTIPESDRCFEIDFVLKDLRIGFEINGNQHYESDRMTLRPYYEARRRHLVSFGWEIIDIHYTLCYKPERIVEIINSAICRHSSIGLEHIPSKDNVASSILAGGTTW